MGDNRGSWMRHSVMVLAAALLLSACAAHPGKSAQPRARPVYPGFDAIYGVGGMVHVLALVRADGSVGEARVEQSSGYPELDRSAIAAVWQWHFNPMLKNGVAADGYVRIPIAFYSLGQDQVRMPRDWPTSYSHPRYMLADDPLPYASVDDALQGVAARTHQAVGGNARIQGFAVRDGEGVVREWWYFTDLDSAEAMAMRFTFAGTPDMPEVRVSVLCRQAAQACDQRTAWLRLGPVFARSM